MRYRLAVDAGTASLALVAYALDDANRPVDIVFTDDWIFSEPLLPAKKGGVGEPKRAARRGGRQMRRQIERRARLLRRVAHRFPFLRPSAEQLAVGGGQNIHLLRANAATKEITLADLSRVFLKMAKRRGYWGTFRPKKKRKKEDRKKLEAIAEAVESGSENVAQQDKENLERGKVESGIDRLKVEMEKASCETLGQYLLYRFEHGQTLKLKNNGLYAHRDMVVAEFEKIWAEQQKHHAELSGKHDLFHEAIFKQRPLKSPSGMVGRCPLEPHHRRAPKVQMVAQAFRIEKQIADLRWGKGRAAEKLSDAQKQTLRDLLDSQNEVSIETVYKEFTKCGCGDSAGRRLNFDRRRCENTTITRPLKGNTTLAAFRRLGLIDEWKALSALNQVRAINLLADMGSPEVFQTTDWNLRRADI